MAYRSKTGLEIVKYWGNGGANTTKFKQLPTALVALGFSKEEAREMKRNMGSEDIGALARRNFIERARRYHPGLYDGPENVYKELTCAYSRVKQLLPLHRPRMEKGYVDAMYFAIPIGL